MNAQAQTPIPTLVRKLPGGRAEHISLESAADITAAPAAPSHRKVRATFKLHSALRGCSTELAILEDHYLSVRSERLRTLPLKYVLDLRFVNPQPVRVRRMAWTWMSVAILAAVATICAAGWTYASTAAMLTYPAFYIAAGSAVAAAAAMFLCIRHTTESLEFTSVHGAAALVSITGGIGSAKSGKRFFVEMIKAINAAKATRPQPEQHFLRDEMREHHRLHELNVLSDQDYEAGKRRILAAHS